MNGKKKRVLLFISKFMEIYKDIENGLLSKDYEVVWVEAGVIPDNPFIKTQNKYNDENIASYLNKAKVLWEERFSNPDFNPYFDYFFAINGPDVHPYMFEYLKSKNPFIRMYLFLYDRVDGVYQIDRFFKFYDTVFSFDISDCQKFGLTFLPIYWIPNNEKLSLKYDVFAFASYSPIKPERTRLYKDIKKLSRSIGLNEYVKLYNPSLNGPRALFLLKNFAKKLLRRPNLSFWDIINGLYTGKSISPRQYREMILCSRIIVDTQALYQDGLTARFMWALGEGKKIVTTNVHVKEYDFYNESQIYVINNNWENLVKFISTPFTPNENYWRKIRPYRLDNWLDTILNS